MLSTEAVTKALEEAVAEKGEEYVYESPLTDYYEGDCFYATPEGAPSCIVGHVFAKLDPEGFQRLFHNEWDGYDPDRSDDDEDEDWSSPTSMSVEGAVESLEEKPEEEATIALWLAQQAQDKGHSWGVAQKVYRTALENPMDAHVLRYNLNGFMSVFRIAEFGEE